MDTVAGKCFFLTADFFILISYQCPLISVEDMPNTSPAVTRSRKRAAKKSVSAKERRKREEANIAFETCEDPPFLNEFPSSTRDLVVSKLKLYHIRLGTKVFNGIAPVMWLHLMEHSTLDGIPEISRETGSFLEYMFR